jgi:hypothetical protein
MIHNVDLQFSVHEATGEIMVTVREESTGEVIREIPPSEMLDLAARIDEMVGLLFHQTGQDVGAGNMNFFSPNLHYLHNPDYP